MDGRDMELARHAVAILNRALNADYTAISDLIGFHVECNEALVNDPHIVVGVQRDEGNEGRWHEVGALGLINGILRKKGVLVGAHFQYDDKTGKLLRFCVMDSKTKEILE